MGGHVVTGSARLHQTVGSCLEWWGWRSAAQQAFRDALRADPLSADAHVYMAESLGRQNRWREASQHLREAVRLRPHDPEVHGNLVLVLARAQQWSRAVEAIDAMIRVRPHEAEAHVLRGALLTRLGRRAEAIRSFRWAVRLPPGPDWRRFFLGEALLGREAWKAAQDAYVLARGLQPAVAAAPASQGTSVLNAHPGDPMVDRLSCSERISRRRDTPARHVVRPLASLEHLGRRCVAAVELRVGAMLPRRPDRTLRALRAGTRPVAVRQAGAVAWFALLLALAAVSSRGENIAAREQARVCFSSSGETAVDACRAALELGLRHDRAALASRTLANELAVLRRWDEMVEACRGLVRLRPEDPEARQRLARVLLQVQDQAEAALREFERAVALDASEPRYLAGLGVTLNTLGRHDEAVAALERAAALDPDYLDAHPAAGAALDASRAGNVWP